MSAEEQAGDAHAAVVARSRELQLACTGCATHMPCDQPPLFVIVFHGVVSVLGCLVCSKMVVQEIMETGHGSCRQDNLRAYSDDQLKRFSAGLLKANAHWLDKDRSKMQIRPGRFYDARRAAKWFRDRQSIDKTVREALS